MVNVVFLTGYYRSGTSALAGALNILGIDFKDTVPVDRFNPMGFYEVFDLIKFDETVFESFGMSWSDIRSLPHSWWLRYELKKSVKKLASILKTDIYTSEICGVKHPHLCRLLPIYEHASKGNTIYNVNIARNPWVCNASQIHKNGLSGSHSLLLWLIYVIEAEKNTRKIQRSWITYDNMMRNPIKQFQKIERELKLNFSNHELAATSIREDLNHKMSLPTALVSKSLISLVGEVWEAIQTEEYNTDLWEDFSDACNDITNLVIDMGKSLKPVAPGVAKS